MGRRPSRADGLIALGVLVLALVETWTSTSAQVRAGVTLSAVVTGVALLWRRAYPTASAVGVLGAGILVDALTPSEALWPIVGLIIAMYSAGRHAPRGRSVGVLTGGLIFDALVAIGEDAGSAGQFVLNYLFIAVLMVGGPWVVGSALLRRERQSAGQAAAAVLDERVRVARELHDVVGHSLGAIAVQAGAERATLGKDAPESTRETLMAIERTTHEALAEMRRLVAVMRSGDEDERLRPQPTLGGIDGILDVARRAGWTCELHIEGGPVALSAGVDLAACRIVQEAVTNAIRHSGGSCVTITIRYLTLELELEVSDNGTPGADADVGGFGLTGMRERAELYGGSLRTRTGRHGGFVVTASLPYVQGIGSS